MVEVENHRTTLSGNSSRLMTSKSTPVTIAVAAQAAAAASPSPHTLALALPMQSRTPVSGGGREDCWSEGATATLIEAWGDRYLELNRGNLKQKHWKDVADAVSRRENGMKLPKTDVQCKNRIDTLKKKYKNEKAKIVASGGTAISRWPFYRKLDYLIGPTKKIASPVIAGSSLPARSDPDSGSAPASPESTDSLPPETTHRHKKRKFEDDDEDEDPALRELTSAILQFGECYERMESLKMHQIVEMEKKWMDLVKEREMQWMDFMVKQQMELSSQMKNSFSKINKNHHNHNNNSMQ